MTLVLTITGLICWLIIGGFLIGRVWGIFKARPKLDIRNSWVIVTGCDSGIGMGVTKKLVAQGASVIAFTYTAEGAKRTLEAGAR